MPSWRSAISPHKRSSQPSQARNHTVIYFTGRISQLCPNSVVPAMISRTPVVISLGPAYASQFASSLLAQYASLFCPSSEMYHEHSCLTCVGRINLTTDADDSGINIFTLSPVLGNFQRWPTCDIQKEAGHEWRHP